MPTPLPAATAEQVIAAAEAVVANAGPTHLDFVASFTDMPADRAEAALNLACELKLLTLMGGMYEASHPMTKLLRTPHVDEKAAVIRILLEQFRPFIVFRQELEATHDLNAAANRTKVTLNLAPHREDIKTTLVGLATFSGALNSAAAGRYEPDIKGISASLKELAAGAAEKADAVTQVRAQLTPEFANTLSPENVIDPFADALRHASGGNAREAVVHAGNAVESFLSAFAAAKQVDIVGATGLNAKLDRLDHAHAIAKKLMFNGKYLGHIRNAADHGVDAEIGQAWTIQEATGLNYVFVALAFLLAVHKCDVGGAEI